MIPSDQTAFLAETHSTHYLINVEDTPRGIHHTAREQSSLDSTANTVLRTSTASPGYNIRSSNSLEGRTNIGNEIAVSYSVEAYVYPQRFTRADTESGSIAMQTTEDRSRRTSSERQTSRRSDLKPFSFNDIKRVVVPIRFWREAAICIVAQVASELCSVY